MRTIFTLLIMFVAAYNATAQTEVQRGVVKKEMEYVAAVQDKQEADNDFTKWCIRMENNIENLKMQHLNDSVSHCYALLTKADSTNWRYLNQAGRWEQNYMARYDNAMKYYLRALTCAAEDTLKATSYNNIGSVYDSQGNYAKALEYYQKALAIYRNVLGEEHPNTEAMRKLIAFLLQKMKKE